MNISSNNLRKIFSILLLSVVVPVKAENAANTNDANLSGLQSVFGNNAELQQTLDDLNKAPKKRERPEPPDISGPAATSNNTSLDVPPTADTSLTDTLEASDIVPEIHVPDINEINESAYQSLLQQAFPMTPDQIRNMHNKLDDTQRAVATDAYSQPPQPTSTSLFVNLSPGATPPVIRLYRGFVSSLVFIDSTGAPWPIVAYDLGNPNAFNIAWNNKDNTLMVQAKTHYTYGNLAVKLLDLDTPVMLTLVPGQRAVDYRVDLTITSPGPHAKKIYSGTNMPNQSSPVLLNILNGVAPKGAKRLNVNGDNTEAWYYQDKMYMRTQYSLVSPAWFGKLSSADGLNAYELPKTPLALLARHGKTVEIKFEGF